MTRFGWLFEGGAKGKRRAPAVDREGQEQAAYFEWLGKALPLVSDHAFHPANGGHRLKAVAGKLKAQGVRAGVPDIYIELPRGAYHGLRIELKATPPHDAAVAPSQKAWRARLKGAGYCALICKGWEAAKSATEAYVSLGPFDGTTRLELDA